MHEDGRAGVDAHLVRRLVEAQFPAWAHLDVVPVAVDGWDNRTYRLGDELSVRLPTGPGYVAAVEKEHRWLPVLAPHLPVPVPVPLALGAPALGFAHPWAVRRWLDGETALAAPPVDRVRFAEDVATFLVALQAVETAGGPPAGGHSAHRGSSPAAYDEDARRCLAALGGRLDVVRLARVWDAALEAARDDDPVWVHGDVAVGNLLVRDGSLCAVIDFGGCAVGDPACDLVLAWTALDGSSREAFRSSVSQDDGTWARARGWALWKALLGLERDPDGLVDRRVVAAVLAEHERLRPPSPAPRRRRRPRG